MLRNIITVLIQNRSSGCNQALFWLYFVLIICMTHVSESSYLPWEQLFADFCARRVKPLSHQAMFPLCWHGFVQISRALWDRKQILIFFAEKGLSRRPYSDHGISTELTWLSIAFLRSSCWRSLRCFHCAFTSLAMRALRFHIVRTGLTVCWRRSEGIFPPFQRFGQGPVKFEKIAFVPSKFGYMYSV